MACRGSQTASIQFLGGVGLAAGGVARAYHDHVLQTLHAAQPGARDAVRAAQAKQQLASSASTVERAVGDVGRASTHRDVTGAIVSAQQALDQARRAGGDRKELLALERKVEAVKRDGQVKARELSAASQRLAVPTDPLSRSVLGVTASGKTAAGTGHLEGQSRSEQPPASVQVLRAELDSLRAGTGSSQELADFSEAVVAGLTAVVRDHSILQQHNPGDSPHGLDVQSLDAAGKVWTFEVKGTRTAGKRPYGTVYRVGRQGSADYVADRSRSSPVSADSAEEVGVHDDQVGSLLVQVNVTDDEVTIWEVDSAGARSATPLEIYRLDDVVDIVDEP